jgi:hypothetical protein
MGWKRGFPDRIIMAAEGFLHAAPRIFAAAPVRSATISGRERIGSEGARALARSPNLRHLTELIVCDNLLQDAGARHWPTRLT